MAKMEQALILDNPTELHFKGPFTDITTSFIKLTNPTDKDICFKVRTTAPRRYCVRPNNGTVSSKETLVVTVWMQPFDIDSEHTPRHKFMVQSRYAPEGEYSIESLWKDTPPGTFMNSVLQCIFEAPSEATSASEDVEPVKAEVKTPPSVQESSV